MGLGKGAPGGNPRLVINLCVGRVACMLDACGLLHEYWDALKTRSD